MEVSRIMRTKIKGMLLLLLFLAMSVISMEGITYAEYADILMNKETESMKKADVTPVIFPHWFHRIRYKCKVCHEDIFIMEKGANKINMDTIAKGEHCGTCHDGRIAWETLYCERCHVSTQPPVGAQK